MKIQHEFNKKIHNLLKYSETIISPCCCYDIFNRRPDFKRKEKREILLQQYKHSITVIFIYLWWKTLFVGKKSYRDLRIIWLLTLFFEVTNTKGTGLQKKWEELITGIKKEARTTEHFLFPCPMHFFLFPNEYFIHKLSQIPKCQKEPLIFHSIGEQIYTYQWTS